jgi:hypothetical protein
MDAQLQALILQMLQQTADGLAAARWAPIGEIETGGETAERFQARMELSVKRLRAIKAVVQGVASPDQLMALWEDHEDEREYQQQQAGESQLYGINTAAPDAVVQLSQLMSRGRTVLVDMRSNTETMDHFASWNLLRLYGEDYRAEPSLRTQVVRGVGGTIHLLQPDVARVHIREIREQGDAIVFLADNGEQLEAAMQLAKRADQELPSPSRRFRVTESVVYEIEAIDGEAALQEIIADHTRDARVVAVTERYVEPVLPSGPARTVG